MMETRDKHVARKKAKGTWGTEKPNRWNGRRVFTGYCPCDCSHELMWDCYAAYCDCCAEVCS